MIVCANCYKQIRLCPEEQEGVCSCWRNAGYVNPQQVRHDCYTCADSNSCTWVPQYVLCCDCYDEAGAS